MRRVDISREPVELFKILKFEGMVASGGEAKLVIADGLVLVNGKVETRKRRKIVSDDVIEFGGDVFLVKSPANTLENHNEQQ
jgi:ribosome-associated protein